MTARHFYHSFPRGNDAELRGLDVLESVLDRGLLLTPERIEFREELSNGSLSQPWYAMQKRMSFTELEPRELPQHCHTFGPYSLEWDIATLIGMGAIPVFYVPLRSVPGSHSAVACSMLARIGEIQKLLVRLDDLETLVRESANQAELLTVTKDGSPMAQTRCSVGGAADLLTMLQHGIQPLSALTGALRALAGYFYPTDHERYTDLLGYYRQREWRLLANILHLGKPITVEVTKEDIEALLRINDEFFGRELDFPTGRKKRVEECQLYKTYCARPVIDTVQRLICPRSSSAKVVEIFESRDVRVPVVAIEDYAAA